MGGHISKPFHSENNKRSQIGFLREAPPGATLTQTRDTSGSPPFCSHFTRSEKTFKKGSCGISPTESRLLQPYIPSSKKERSKKDNNKFKTLEQRPFRQASLSSVCQLLRPKDWAVSLDFKDAYFHVPVH